MGLAVSVGLLADLLQNDPEGAEWLVGSIAVVNRVLEDSGLPVHTEPRELVPVPTRSSIGGFPYSFIHYLRRAYAHGMADPSWRATPLPEDSDPSTDAVLEAETEQFSSHLLCHSDCEGYYVPIDFPEVLFDESGQLPGGMLGSSQRLMGELIAVAPALCIQLQNGELSDQEASRIDGVSCSGEGLSREYCSWLALYEAARISIAQKALIAFT